MNDACSLCGTPLPQTGSCPSCGGTRADTPRRAAPRKKLEEQLTRIHALVPGETLEKRFRIRTELVSGPLSTVYLADDLSAPGAKVAVKILSPALCRDQEFVERFERESKLMARVKHPHLIPLLSVGWRGALPYIVMPMLEGAPLSARLRSEGKLSDADALAMIRQVGHALSALHEQKLVHRDLKPSNIFANEDGTYTLLDLGVAHDGLGPLLTRPGYMIGTAEYMAPEQVTGKTVDARADVYAFGVVLFEVFTGKVPFTGADTHEVLRAHQVKPPPDAAASGVPGPIARALQKAMAKKPADRFQTVQDLVARMELLLEEAATASEPDHPRRRR